MQIEKHTRSSLLTFQSALKSYNFVALFALNKSQDDWRFNAKPLYSRADALLTHEKNQPLPNHLIPIKV